MTLSKKPATLTLAALVAATLSTAVFAQTAPEAMGAGMGPMPMVNFDAMDADKDGSVTKEEVTAAMTARATEADTDKDGKLSPEELVVMHEKAQAARKLDRANAMITRLDADKDGVLTLAEMAAAPGADRMFSHLDANADGTISKEEVEAMMSDMGEMGQGGHRGKGGKGGHGRGHDGHDGHGGGMWGWMGDDN